MKFMKQLLGFSTGGVGGIAGISERLKFLQTLGCNAVELGYVFMERLTRDPLEKIDPRLLDGFEWVSLHAPGSVWKYDPNDETSLAALSKIEAFHRRRPLDLVVFHPDSFPDSDFSILKNISFPVGIENMDNLKPSFQRPDSLGNVFTNRPEFGFVLDVNHCFVNDSSLKLAAALLKAFHDRLRQVHVSGFVKLHEPLFQTKQVEILRAVPTGYPVIIESMCESPQEVRAEWKYVRNVLQSLAR